MGKRILWVEDEQVNNAWLHSWLEQGGCEVDAVRNRLDGERRLHAMARGDVHYDLAIFDVMVAVASSRELYALSPEDLRSAKASGCILLLKARGPLGLTELPVILHTVLTQREVEEKLNEYAPREDILTPSLSHLNARHVLKAPSALLGEPEVVRQAYQLLGVSLPKETSD